LNQNKAPPVRCTAIGGGEMEGFDMKQIIEDGIKNWEKQYSNFRKEFGKSFIKDNRYKSRKIIVTNDYDLEKDAFFKEKLQGIHNAVYIISSSNFPYLSYPSDKEITDKRKELGKEYKLARFKPRGSKPQKKPLCLYVGSSIGTKRTGITTRIKQHLEKSSSGTFALHLAAWCKNDESIEINFDIWDFSSVVEGNPIYLQIIEDIIWENYKPLFGKKGAK
jgi:hypothetical protein